MRWKKYRCWYHQASLPATRIVMDPTDRPQFIEHVHKRHTARTCRYCCALNCSSLSYFSLVASLLFLLFLNADRRPACPSPSTTSNGSQAAPVSSWFAPHPPTPPDACFAYCDAVVQIGSYPKNTGALHMYQVSHRTLRHSHLSLHQLPLTPPAPELCSLLQLAHGELKTLVETEKPHAFKCCTFGASRCLSDPPPCDFVLWI